MFGRAGKLMFAQHDLLLPGVQLISRIVGRKALDHVAALHSLPAVAPGRDAARVYDLAFDVEAADQEVVAFVFQILEERPRVLSHQNRVRRVVMNPELITDAVFFADSVESDPRPRGVGDVVMPVVAWNPARHRALLDAVSQSAVLGGFQERDEPLL